jgi:hypothetical protein
MDNSPADHQDTVECVLAGCSTIPGEDAFLKTRIREIGIDSSRFQERIFSGNCTAAHKDTFDGVSMMRRRVIQQQRLDICTRFRENVDESSLEV